MQIDALSTNVAVLNELGERIKDVRIAQGYTQAELARRAGVSVRTLSSLESGAAPRFEIMLNVLRALGLLQNLEGLVPEQGARPSDLAKLGKKRQRASAAHKAYRTGKTTWKWGDER